MTPRLPIGVPQGGGGSRRDSSLFPIGLLGVIYDVHIAAHIRVKSSISTLSSEEAAE